MNTVFTIDRDPDPERRLRREWASSLAECMAEWVDPDVLTGGGMSVKRLVSELEALGVKVSQQAVYAWLAADYSPRPRHQGAVAKVLGVKVRHLFPIEAAA